MKQSTFLILIFILLSSNIFSQTIEKDETNKKGINNKIKNTEKTYAPQTIGDKVIIKDNEGNALIEINDEGTLGSITLPDSTGEPTTTTNKLYNVSGTLNFNGTALGASGANQINDLSDAKYDGSSLFLGNGAGTNDDGTNNQNTAVGIDALRANTTGSNNTANGRRALYSNTTGSYNTANGRSALNSNTTGSYNTAHGYSALNSNIDGIRNTANGRSALSSNTAGDNNTANGMEALYSNTTGNKNVALGYQAGYNETGSDKLYIDNSNTSSPLIWGDFANDSLVIHGNFHVTGNITNGGASPVVKAINDLSDGSSDGSSVFLGTGAGTNDDGTTNQNTAVGVDALYSNTTGSTNTANGRAALYNNTTGIRNTANGYYTLYSSKAGNYGVAIGYMSQRYANNTATSYTNYNTSVGYQSLQGSQSASVNTGNYNSAFGNQSLYSNTAGNNNTANGYRALYSNTTGYSNTANGYSALYSNKGGIHNTANGYSALKSNTEGERNTAYGNSALYSNTTGNDNTANGRAALYSNTSGSGNVALGYNAGYNETGSNKLYIDNSNTTSPLIWGDFANDIAAINGKLGVGEMSPTAKVHINADSGQDAIRVQINGATKLWIYSNGGTTLGSNHGVANTPANGLYVHGDLEYNAALTSVSDERYKTDIEPISSALKSLQNIRGVYYNWNRDKFPEREFTDKKQIGVLAQEVEKEFPELVRTGNDGYKSVDYTKLAPILIEAVKEQQASIKYQGERIKKLEEENKKLASVLNEVNNIKTALNKLIQEQPKINISVK